MTANRRTRARRLVRRVAPLVLLAAAAGCAPDQCDPRNAGFFGGIGCAAGGGYGQRTYAQQQGLAAANADALEARAAARYEGSRAAYNTAAANAAARRLGALDGSITRMRRQVAAARQRGADEGRVSQLNAQLDQLQQDRNAAGSAPTDADVRRLEQRQRQLADIAAAM